MHFVKAGGNYVLTLQSDRDETLLQCFSNIVHDLTCSLCWWRAQNHLSSIWQKNVVNWEFRTTLLELNDKFCGLKIFIGVLVELYSILEWPTGSGAPVCFFSFLRSTVYRWRSLGPMEPSWIANARARRLNASEWSRLQPLTAPPPSNVLLWCLDSFLQFSFGFWVLEIFSKLMHVGFVTYPPPFLTV